MDKILNKIDMFLTSESRVYGEKVDGMRPINKNAVEISK